MERQHRASADRMHRSLIEARSTPVSFREDLLRVPAIERDAWFDRVLGLDGGSGVSALPDDGPDLPRGCVPYLPCSVNTLLEVIEHANIGAADRFVDVGSGLGRAALFVHFWTGAPAIGLEIQRALVETSQQFAARLNADRFRVIEGDAALLAGFIMIGTVFFLYCPFSGARLSRVLNDLEAIARTRTIRVCCVGMSLPARSWLTLHSPPARDFAVYRSTFPLYCRDVTGSAQL